MTRPLHIAVDAHDLARDRRGIGSYIRALLGRYVLRDDVRLTLLVRDPFPPRFARAFRAAIGVEPRHRLRIANRVPGDADVVWHPWNGTFFSGRAGAVVTLHDLVPFALPAGNARRRVAQQLPFARSARSAQTIICDSQFTASEAQRYLAIEPARIVVVPLGVEPAFSTGDTSELPAALRGRRYLLYVGAHDQHKNVTTLTNGFRAAFTAADDIALVFTRPNPLVPEALVFDDVVTARLVALYRGAWLVAVPSIYEGFGLPVLEALACGAPVLASRAASLPEVGGDAIAYVDAPSDVAAWRRALRAFADEPGLGAALAQAGPRRAASFTWATCATRTLDILRLAADTGR